MASVMKVWWLMAITSQRNIKIKIFKYIYIYIYIYIYNNYLNTASPSSHHHNGFRATGALVHTHVWFAHPVLDSTWVCSSPHWENTCILWLSWLFEIWALCVFLEFIFNLKAVAILLFDCSLDQVNIFNDQSAETTARAVSISYCL